MYMQKEREAFSEWHESAYGEYVTWGNDYPVSHIHNDRWEAWQAAKASAVPDGYVVVPKEPTEKMIDAGHDFCKNNIVTPSGFYKAMIEAAQDVSNV